MAKYFQSDEKITPGDEGQALHPEIVPAMCYYPQNLVMDPISGNYNRATITLCMHA